ncbi:unnamed protein product [Ambrosiozyma monospora]|uniref:Unnamed protein product n=1 Tax=Ambrosiozyma monospora TaxID=43982 RepID=A0A9W6WI40_AMBMO|nr:unnamed protein product [Ambrosiozyma monospora]
MSGLEADASSFFAVLAPKENDDGAPVSFFSAPAPNENDGASFFSVPAPNENPVFEAAGVLDGAFESVVFPNIGFDPPSALPPNIGLDPAVDDDEPNESPPAAGLLASAGFPNENPEFPPDVLDVEPKLNPVDAGLLLSVFPKENAGLAAVLFVCPNVNPVFPAAGPDGVDAPPKGLAPVFVLVVLDENALLFGVKLGKARSN